MSLEKFKFNDAGEDRSSPRTRRDHRSSSPRRAEIPKIFENATEGIFQTTPEGKYLSANPALARMYGYDSPGELLEDLIDIGRQLYVEPDRRRKFTLAMRSDGQIEDFESQIYRRDGSVIWISENARAVHDEVTGELLYYEGMVLDITRRKAAEEARKQAEENLVRYAEELRVKNSQFKADLEMARDIQQVFLTQNFPSFPRSLTPQESWLGFAIGTSRQSKSAAIFFAFCLCQTRKPVCLFATCLATVCGLRS